jgi:hypothetical protein
MKNLMPLNNQGHFNCEENPLKSVVATSQKIIAARVDQ